MIFLINPMFKLLFGMGFFSLIGWTVAIIMFIIGMIKVLFFDK